MPKRTIPRLPKAFADLEEPEIAEEDPIISALDKFFAEGLISEILHVVKSGKEATVYCCQAQPSLGVELVAAKVYRSRDRRNFKNDAVYQEGRVILDSHLRRAVKAKSRVGREAQFSMWVHHEFEALTTLYAAGAAIPRPLRMAESAILMEYMGDREQAAPSLQGVTLHLDEVYPLFNHLMDNIQLCLEHNYIHADLSAYNILYWQGQSKIIDFPQAVDPRFNPNAFSLLVRDIDNICKYFARYDLQRDAMQLAERLWRKFKFR